LSDAVPRQDQSLADQFVRSGEVLVAARQASHTAHSLELEGASSLAKE